MADTFLNAINTGINIGHMADSARMQRQQMEKAAQLMQMQENEYLMKVAEFNQKQTGLDREEAQRQSYTPGAPVYGAYGTGPGQNWENPPNLNEMGPSTMTGPGAGAGRLSLQQAGIPNFDAAADFMLYGEKPAAVLNLPQFKKEVPEKIGDTTKVVGNALVDVNTGKPIYEAPVKPDGRPSNRQIPWGYGQMKDVETGEIFKVPTAPTETSRNVDLTDKDVLMPQIRALPKMKQDAEASNKRVLLYENLSKMAESGSGGLMPGLKGILSPVLEAMGLDAKIESEAQAYQLMARAGVGSMRLMLVGSGQVSNYEQDLMQRLSGGSIKTSREAAKLLFKYYADESRYAVTAYNKTIDDLTQVAPVIGGVYKKIPMRGTEPVNAPNSNSPAFDKTVKAPLKNTKGWVLNTDAQGNQAYVSPDGKSFEEVR